MNRYDNVIKSGSTLQISKKHVAIRNAIKNGSLPYTTIVLKGNERLDVLAGRYYNDSSLWWVISAASDIGWGLQIPPDTVVNIPDINQVRNLLGQ